MAPIRVALVGLSANATTSWAAEAHLPYLLSPRGRSHYIVTALLNSSTEAAEAARGHYGLPDDVRAYGDPEALARDPDVDLVVCSTRVDTHFDVVAPSARAGKAVYVEWPLAEDLERSEALAQLVAQSSWGSIVGLQGRAARVVLRIRDVVLSGCIGKVLGSDVEAYGSLLSRDELPEGLAYFAERKVGGNPVTIAFGHMIDYVHHVVGEFDGGFESRLQIQRAEVRVLLGDGAARRVRSDVPDFVALHGALRGRDDDTVAVDGATLAVRFRNGPPFKGRSALVWRIVGEKGEVEVESPAGPYLHSDSYDEPVVIRVHDHERDEVEEVSWDWEGWQKELPVRARNVGEVYERFARWAEAGRGNVEEDGQWSTVQDAFLRMRELEALLQGFGKPSGEI
ncbi:oxidoreductase family protein [Colletotrichum graminicola]|uniref:Oxidoreductase family protein n=1 Tax=Colletotrichum graminicola (strain M1.001 / M2 / FGSC 10212) TaxID=645133 RepID=E3R0K8_COLGM|nr:oxidoreductase family protein [Colletotrichum graminicola M1.001]EFQ36646.1 oxidoreductase family protein [Colletotrichum graminicola M1.001]WDK22159.1 oxidoreductase family protein [Colletotrichum graminicola]